jgi:hypothetical protein
MIAASFIGIFVIPGLYVVFQTLREKAHALIEVPASIAEPPKVEVPEANPPKRP